MWQKRRRRAEEEDRRPLHEDGRDWWDTGPDAWVPGADAPLDVNLTTLEWCNRGGAFKWCGVGTAGESCAGWILPHNAATGHTVTFDFWVEKQKWVDPWAVDGAGCICKDDLRGFTDFAQADEWLRVVEAAIIADRRKFVARACPVGWFYYWESVGKGEVWGGAGEEEEGEDWESRGNRRHTATTAPEVPTWYTERLFTPVRLCEHGEAIGAQGCKDTCPGQYLHVRAAWPGLLSVFQSWIVEAYNADLDVRMSIFPEDRQDDIRQPVRLYETDRTPERFLLEQLGCLSTSSWWRLAPPYAVAVTTASQRVCPDPGPDPGRTMWGGAPAHLAGGTAAIPRRGAICVPRRAYAFLAAATQFSATPPGTPGIPLVAPLRILSYDGEMTSGRAGMPVPRWSDAARKAKPATELVHMGTAWSVWAVGVGGGGKPPELWLAPQWTGQSGREEDAPPDPERDAPDAEVAPVLLAVLPRRVVERTVGSIARRQTPTTTPTLLWADLRWFPAATVLADMDSLKRHGSIWAMKQPSCGEMVWVRVRPVRGTRWPPPAAGATRVAMSPDHGAVPATYGGLPTITVPGLRRHAHDSDPVAVLSSVMRTMGGPGEGTRRGLQVCSLAWERPDATEPLAPRPGVKPGCNDMHPTQLNAGEGGLDTTTHPTPPSTASTRLLPDEPELLLAWFRLLWEWSPDIIIGYNISGWDAPYIVERVLWWYEYLRDTGERPELMERLAGAAAGWGYWHEPIIGWSRNGLGFRSYHGPGARSMRYVLWGGLAHLDPIHLIRDNQAIKLRDYKLDSVAMRVLSERKIAVDVKRGAAIHRAGGAAFRGFIGYCEDDAVKPLLICERIGLIPEAMTKACVNRWGLTHVWEAGTMDVNKGNLTHYAHLRTYIVPVFAEDQVHASHFHAPGLLDHVLAQSDWSGKPPNEIEEEDVPPAPGAEGVVGGGACEDVEMGEAELEEATGIQRERTGKWAAEQAAWMARADVWRADPRARNPGPEKPHRPAPIHYPPGDPAAPTHPTYTNHRQNFTTQFGKHVHDTPTVPERFPLVHFAAGHPRTQLSYIGNGSTEYVDGLEKKWKDTKIYGGGRVLQTLPGWIFGAYTLLEDYASLYPWVMRCHNVCPTLLCDAFTRALYGIDRWRCARHVLGPAFGKDAMATGELEWEPGENQWVRVTYSLVLDRDGNCVPMGLLGTAEVTLQAARDRAKKEMAAAKDAKQTVLAANKFREEQAIKVVMNALYGMFGKWTKGRWPCTEVAAIIASRGRYALTHLEQVVSTLCPRGTTATIMGDTDSNFVTIHPALAPDIHGARAFGSWLERAINLHMKHYMWDIVDGGGRVLQRYCARHDVEHEGTMRRALMMYVKKRYSAAMDKVPRDDPGDPRGPRVEERKGRGMEDVRRDSSTQTARMVHAVLEEVIMSWRPREEIIPRVRQIVLSAVEDVVAGRFKFSEVVMSKKLKEHYAEPDKQAHVRVVRDMEAAEPGSAPPVMARVPYVFRYLPVKRVPGKKKMRVIKPSVADKATAPGAMMQETEADLDMGAYVEATLKSVSKILEHLDPDYERIICEPAKALVTLHQGRRERVVRRAAPTGALAGWLRVGGRRDAPQAAADGLTEAAKDATYYAEQARACWTQCRSCQELTGTPASECANDSCPNLLDRAWSARRLRRAHGLLGTAVPVDIEDLIVSSPV